MNDQQKKLDIALLVGRIIVGLIFILAGWGKLTGIEGVQGLFGDVGIPLAGVMAWVVALVEFVGGIMVLVGYKTRTAALLLALVMVGAIVFVKLSQGWNAMRLDMALFALNLTFYLVGAGSMSIEGKAAAGADE
ncbi:MAG: DoxX family protein [Balneolaceae bacterium]